jgi:hypothetical protein
MDASLSDRMTPLLQRLATALVQATPEKWDSAKLLVRVIDRAEGATEMAHEIACEEFPNELISPTDEIFAATRELQQFCSLSGQPFRTLTFAVNRVGQHWKYETDFGYGK